MPALPLNEAGEYVAGAYIVFFALILIYVSIMAIRLRRIERDLGELLKLTEPPAQSSLAQDEEADHRDPERQAAVT